ncbi:MAG: hypothetical protein IMY67_06755 [Bacteroidetes bacterium]|nr:hypothetical protein [Bacteroidota bacterium]
MTISLSAQDIDIIGAISSSVILSNQDQIPFWMHTNTNTALGATTNVTSTGEINATYHFKSSFLEVGAAVFYRDGVEDNFQRRDVYVRYKNSWLSTTLGAKKQDAEQEGLSVTNKNFIWSSNARPLTGFIVEANNPLKASSTFAIDWGIAHYSLNDDRYVSDTWVHYKRLGLIVTFNENHKITARIQHFAQWAGTSPTYGDLPDDFSAFIEVFFAKETTAEGENINALGNHIGSYLLDYEFKTSIGDFSVYHEHPFEDGSGSRLANFPDGVWGVYFSPKKTKFMSNLLYEYIDTTDQSGSSGVSGRDNYFNNNLYRSGWTYEGNIIGVPLIFADSSIQITDATSPIVSNRVRAHHFGVMGSFKNIDWTLKTTYSKSLGTYNTPFIPTLETWFNYVSFSYNTDKYGEFMGLGGVDFSPETDTIIGGGISYKYIF